MDDRPHGAHQRVVASPAPIEAGRTFDELRRRQRLGLIASQPCQGLPAWPFARGEGIEQPVEAAAQALRALQCIVRVRGVLPSSPTQPSRLRAGQQPDVAAPCDEVLVVAESFVLGWRGLTAARVEEVEGQVAADDSPPRNVVGCFHQNRF